MFKTSAVHQFKATLVTNVRTPTKKKLSTILKEKAIKQELKDKKDVVAKFIPEVDPELTNNLTMTDPIPPKYSELIKTSKDIVYEDALVNHPLWNFFIDKKLVRNGGYFSTSDRAWTTAELRLKSFNDLHFIYISCMKEVNVLNRELAYADPSRGFDSAYISTSKLSEQKKKINTTMLNIRTVLKDRKLAHELAVFELIDRHIFKELDYDYKKFRLLKAEKELYNEKAQKYIQIEMQRLLEIKKNNLNDDESIEDYQQRLEKSFKMI